MKRSHLTIIAILFMLGLFFELLKNFDIVRTNESNQMRISWGAVDFTPYAVNSNSPNKNELIKTLAAKKRGFRLSGKPVKGSYDTSEGHNAAQKLAQNKKAADDKKKKKAKKSRGKKKETEVAKATEQTIYEERDTRNKVTESQNNDSPMGAPQAAQPTENKEPSTYEDWAKLILGRPNPENVQLLVDSYRAGQTSADVFYGILNAMLSESNSEQQELAVYAAGTVVDAQSFLFLVQVVKTKPAGSSAHTIAMQQINDYRSLQSVGELKLVFNVAMKDPVTVLLATRVLNTSTANYISQTNGSTDNSSTAPVTDSNAPISGRAPVTDNDSTQTTSGSALSRNRFVSVYKSFENILEQVIATYSNNGEITENANSALTRIRTLTPQTVIAAGEIE